MYDADLLYRLSAAMERRNALRELVNLRAGRLLRLLHALTGVNDAMDYRSEGRLNLRVRRAALNALFFLRFLRRAPGNINDLDEFYRRQLVTIMTDMIILGRVAGVRFALPLISLRASPFYFRRFHLSFVLWIGGCVCGYARYRSSGPIGFRLVVCEWFPPCCV